ncbi:MAG TPA: hypothetical protein VE974_19255 [Thermoanaerobaculia bacterium]|nr:hypothetical protein [Thermoanaerobaculia bacterium]
MDRHHLEISATERCKALLSALRSGDSPASELAPPLRDLAEELLYPEISAAVTRELHGYQTSDVLPPGVEAGSFAATLGLNLLESKIHHTRAALHDSHAETDTGNIKRISLAVEDARLTAALQNRRTHLASLAGDLLRKISSVPEKWVISLHGIQTRGQWQKDLSQYMDAGLRYAPFDYKWFDALRLLSESARDRRIDAFRDQYERLVETRGAIPSIIAHSFGSYIVTRAIEKYALEFDRVILCGSIVRRDYPWTAQFDAVPPRVQRVLNDFGGRDLWARLAVWVIKDAGQSGVHGFDDEAGGRLIQRGHSWFRHSDYFYAGNYRKRWIPFLQGADPAEHQKEHASQPNWRNRAVQLIVVLAAAVLLWYFTR